MCYHTYEEIVALARVSQWEKDEHAEGRRLQTADNAVTYAEITIDTAVLVADSKSDLSAAQSFLQGILASGALDDVNGTVQVRCIRYTVYGIRHCSVINLYYIYYIKCYIYYI
jgi:hypothetical protein